MGEGNGSKQQNANVTLVNVDPSVLAVTFLDDGRQLQLRVFRKDERAIYTIVRSSKGSKTIWIEARIENDLDAAVRVYEERVAAASKAA